MSILLSWPVKANYNIQKNTPEWYSNTSFFKKWGDPSLRPMIVLATAILKLFCFALVLPIFVTVLPIPDFDLNADVAKSYVINENAPFGPVILTKAMFFYFSSLAAYEVFEKIFRSLNVEPVNKQD